MWRWEKDLARSGKTELSTAKQQKIATFHQEGEKNADKSQLGVGTVLIPALKSCSGFWKDLFR